ncbi:hypothetical protein SAMN05661091_0871 [Paenibacillus uliginis N3/975]|uniref:YqbQ/XkdQ domain-containing protein n=1 Tax=Paenibacillus uliginis N3/975 TaxID=1313296 RepID=A0A1X7GNM6_9BACL|nr:hypothetical protein [Paenibacillus uliginis]SMF72457.1 hypothetical protein SAMN05661091_0871 [Paenibacillus uliginis N3/975]
MIEIMLDRKNGSVWDLGQVVTDITWKTSRQAKPASLDITFVNDGLAQSKKFDVANGDIVRFRKDNKDLFYGYVFSKEWGADAQVKLMAYDQVRYLSSNETYRFENVKVEDIIRKIAKDYNLKTGELTDTKHTIPSMLQDNKKLIDTISKGLDATLIATGQYYMFYDQFGELTLKNINEMLLMLAIGEDSLMTDFSYKKSIDNETYNRIKVVRDNKETGKRDVYLYQHGQNIAQWGLLSLYEVADENMNPAQLKELAKNLLELKNREEQTLSVEAIGDLRVRAGNTIYVNLPGEGLKPYLIDECTHKFSNGTHTMSLNMKVV